jgi:aminocarboxymuconate-semialdehyde decarboxylase
MSAHDDLGTTVVDVHCHMVPGSATRAAQRGEVWHGVPMGIGPHGGLSWEIGGARWNLTWENQETGFDDRIARMDEYGVDVQVLSLSPAFWWYYALSAAEIAPIAVEVNDSIAEALQAHPTRFMGLAHLPLQDAGASVAELERCVSELGFAGVAVPGNVAGVDWDSADLFRVLEAAAGLDAMVFVHPATDVRVPGRSGPYFFPNIIGIPVETTMALASMIFGGVFDRLPDLRVCLAHGGGYGCMALGRWDHAHRVRPECRGIEGRPSDYASKVWFDSLTHSHTALRFLLDEVGPNQVVLGTDYPADMGQVDPVAWVRAARQLSAEEHRLVLGENARQLLGPHRLSPQLEGRPA